MHQEPSYAQGGMSKPRTEFIALNPSTSESVGSAPGGWTRIPLEWKTEKGLAGWIPHSDPWAGDSRGGSQQRPTKEAFSSDLPASLAFSKAVSPEDTSPSPIHIWPLCSPALNLRFRSSHLESDLFVKATHLTRKRWHKKKMDQKKVAGMKERGKKDEQREEREIWNRAIFYSSFMSCSGTLHSFPLLQPPHRCRQHRNRVPGHKRWSEVWHGVPCRHPHPACPPLLHNLLSGQGLWCPL